MSTSSAATPSSSLARKLLQFVAVLAIAGLLAVWMSRKFNTFEPEGGLAVGEMAPNLVVAGWINGSGPSPSDLEGKVVLISAWGNHCPACEEEVPQLLALHKEFGDRVVFLGLTDADADDLQGKNYLTRHQINWSNGYGAIPALEALHCHAYPMAWVVGADGRIAWNLDSKLHEGISLEEGLKRALAKKA